MATPLPQLAMWAELVRSTVGPAAPLDYVTRYVMEESGGHPEAWSVNKTGSLAGTADCGLGQINQTNWSWLSEKLGTPFNAVTCKDPRLNLMALRAWWGTESKLASGSETAGYSIKVAGTQVSYVEHMSNRRYRQLDGPPVAAPAIPPKPVSLVLHSGTARDIDFRR